MAPVLETPVKQRQVSHHSETRVVCILLLLKGVEPTSLKTISKKANGLHTPMPSSIETEQVLGGIALVSRPLASTDRNKVPEQNEFEHKRKGNK